LLPRQVKLEKVLPWQGVGKEAVAVRIVESVKEDVGGEVGEVEVSYRKVDSSKVTWREMITRRDKRSKQWYPLWHGG
jgi:hypothetical protein